MVQESHERNYSVSTTSRDAARQGSHLDRKIVNGVAVVASDVRIRASLQQRNASTELGNLSLLLFKLQSLLLDLFVGNTLR
jgi:hypothetical protein